MPLRSFLCRQEHFSSEWYHTWRQRMAAAAPAPDPSRPDWDIAWAAMQNPGTLHRKLWEWCAIAQALAERDLLREGSQGIGFAVGREPLASMFAASGAEIVASDFKGDQNWLAWAMTGQFADSLESVHWPGFLSLSDFMRRVSYQNIDMRKLEHLPRNAYDFCWSSCSFEHLGSLSTGMRFVLDSMALIRKGGVAVHTTEFNVTSNDATIKKGDSVIYRRRDIEELDYRLRAIGCALESPDFNPGSDEHDVAFDRPPYYSHGKQHVKLQLGSFVSTSILLIIRKWV